MDDPDTPVDEGAEAGDILTFRIWDHVTGKDYSVQPTVFTGTYPPIWSADGDISHVNLAAVNSQTIPLQQGWNLISFSVNTCFYKEIPHPTVPMLEGLEYVHVGSIAEVLTSIAGKYEVVRGFDRYGAHTYDPTLSDDFNDLTYLAPGYGYWIKMKEAGELTLRGSRVGMGKSLDLVGGWNLVGYWPDVVYYTGTKAPAMTFATPPSPMFSNHVDSLMKVLKSLEGNVEVIRGFDADGYHSFKPDVPAFINDLNYLGPGYGYWLRVKESGSLHY